MTLKKGTRSEGAALCAQMETLEMAFMAIIIHGFGILYYPFQATSTVLLRGDIALLTAVRAFESLRDFVAAQRHFFDSFEMAALSVPGVSQTWRHDSHRRTIRKTFADESGEQDTELDGRRKFQVETFNVAIDTLTQSLGHVWRPTGTCAVCSVCFSVKNLSPIPQ